MVINNTIKITVFNRRKEINIMKLVGATNGFIRFPFFVEGVTSGLISAALASGIICGAYYALTLVCREPFNLSQMFGGQPVPLAERLVLPCRRLCAAGLRALRHRYRHQHP